MKARALFASFFVCGMVTLGVSLATRGASAATNSTSVPVAMTCTSTGQQCDSVYRQTVNTTSVLTLEFESAWDGCAQFSVTFPVDGVAVFTSAPLAPFASTGPIDAGPASAGSHLLEVRATGVVDGCDQGTLASWGGRFTATTNDDPVTVSPTPTDPVPSPTPSGAPGGDPKSGCKKGEWKSAEASIYKNQGDCVSDDARPQGHEKGNGKDGRDHDRGRDLPRGKGRH